MRFSEGLSLWGPLGDTPPIRNRMLTGPIYSPQGDKHLGHSGQRSLLCSPKRELEHRIPRLHSPLNSWRLPETFVLQEQTTFLYIFLEICFSPWISVGNRSLYPILKHSLIARRLLVDGGELREDVAAGRAPERAREARLGATQRYSTPRTQI